LMGMPKDIVKYCSQRDLNFFINQGIVGENLEVDLDGIREMCEGFAGAAVECPTCYDLDAVLSSKEPLRVILEYMAVEPLCAAYVAKVANSACVEALKRALRLR